MFFDSHVHTEFSHDSDVPMSEQYRRAETLGLKGFAVTDHYELVDEAADFSQIRRSAEQAKRLDQRGKIRVFCGAEFGDGIGKETLWNRCAATLPFDVILGSVHTRKTFSDMGIQHADYTYLRTLPEEQIPVFLDRYYENVLFTVREMDFDVLTHLTLPLRYLNGRFHRNVTLDGQREKIELILKELIRRNGTLEINTSGVQTDWNQTMPDREFLSLYYSLGGRTITLGSDSHRSDTLGNGLETGAKLAQEVGFRYYCYYEKRQPVKVSFSS